MREFTDRKRAEKEKKKLQSQLQQVRKLEAIGTLAGGIAHDFNNMLAAVIGSLSLAQMECGPGDPIYEYLAEAEKAAMRSNELANKLITFSKGGEPVIKPVSLPGLLKKSIELPLRNSGIRYEILVPDDLGLFELDARQIGQAIQNVIIKSK